MRPASPGPRSDSRATSPQANNSRGVISARTSREPCSVSTSASWLKLVERWLRELTEPQLRRGVFRSVPDLVAAIEALVAAYSTDPKPFVWTASVETIRAKVNRCKAILETHQ